MGAGTGSGTDLTGLSPEQINQIAGRDIEQQRNRLAIGGLLNNTLGDEATVENNALRRAIMEQNTESLIGRREAQTSADALRREFDRDKLEALINQRDIANQMAMLRETNLQGNRKVVNSLAEKRLKLYEERAYAMNRKDDASVTRIDQEIERNAQKQKLLDNMEETGRTYKDLTDRERTILGTEPPNGDKAATQDRLVANDASSALQGLMTKRLPNNALVREDYNSGLPYVAQWERSIKPKETFQAPFWNDGQWDIYELPTIGGQKMSYEMLKSEADKEGISVSEAVVKLREAIKTANKRKGK